MSLLDSLRDLGQRSLDRDEDERKRRVASEYGARIKALAKISQDASKAVRRLLGEDVLASLGEWYWSSSDVVLAAIGTPDSDLTPGCSYLPGDAPGQDGELRYYGNSGELWYRPRMTNASARIRDREHLARMIVQHSIYA